MASPLPPMIDCNSQRISASTFATVLASSSEARIIPVL